jgi:hypothetical protein
LIICSLRIGVLTLQRQSRDGNCQRRQHDDFWTGFTAIYTNTTLSKGLSDHINNILES